MMLIIESSMHLIVSAIQDISNLGSYQASDKKERKKVVQNYTATVQNNGDLKFWALPSSCVMQSCELRIIFLLVLGCGLMQVGLTCVYLILICFVTGYRVITTPLPSGGPVLISMLNILDGFKFSKEDKDKSLTYHYMIEVITQNMQLASLCQEYNIFD